MDQVIVRQAVRNDAPAVFHMLRSLAHEVGEGDEFVSTLEDLRRDGLGPRPHFETLLAEIHGKPGAVATFFQTYSTHKGRPCLYIDNLYVEAWARGRRLGQLLMARVCRLAVERSCCRVELKVLTDNSAREFYRTIGMTETREIPCVIRDEAMHRLAQTADNPV